MRDVAVVGFAQSPSVRREISGNEVEMLMPILLEAKRQAGLKGTDIGFTVSGSCDYLAGQPFACAHVLLDGADLPFFALIQECPFDEVRMGMRVEAVWAPKEEIAATFESIRYFRPIDEPDASYDSYKEHT